MIKTETPKDMLRDIVGNEMLALGQKDERVVVVNADLMKTSRNQTFVKTYPNRSFNVGIAEAFMVSYAAGLAHEGFIPYVFSMAPFLSMRACEQCRTDVAYGNLDVRLIGTYAGVSGGISGATHWGIEDVGIMRSIPGMTVIEPSDARQAVGLLTATLSYKGPVYMRISVEPAARLYQKNESFEIGKAMVLKEGEDGAYICSGAVVWHAVEAAVRIKERYGYDVRVVDMHTIKPIDREAVIAAAGTGAVVAAQDHNVEGGLGNAVAEIIAEEGISCRFDNAGISDCFEAMAHPGFLFHQFGYDTEGLEKRMLARLMAPASAE